MLANSAVNYSGMQFAICFLSGQPYRMAPDQDKESLRAAHQDLYQNVLGEYSILGLVATTPPDKVIEQMLEGIDEPSKEWLKECDLTFEALNVLPAGERAYFLIAPLTTANP